MLLLWKSSLSSFIPNNKIKRGSTLRFQHTQWLWKLFCVCGLEKLVLQNCGGYFPFAIWDWNEFSLTSYCKWIFSLTAHKTNTICRNAKQTDMFVTETITKIVLRINAKSVYMLLSKKSSVIYPIQMISQQRSAFIINIAPLWASNAELLCFLCWWLDQIVK